MLLYVSVSPFGQTGPHAKLPATDLTIAASGGYLNMRPETATAFRFPSAFPKRRISVPLRPPQTS